MGNSSLLLSRTSCKLSTHPIKSESERADLIALFKDFTSEMMFNTRLKQIDAHGYIHYQTSLNTMKEERQRGKLREDGDKSRERKIWRIYSLLYFNLASTVFRLKFSCFIIIIPKTPSTKIWTTYSTTNLKASNPSPTTGSMSPSAEPMRPFATRWPMMRQIRRTMSGSMLLTFAATSAKRIGNSTTCSSLPASTCRTWIWSSSSSSIVSNYPWKFWKRPFSATVLRPSLPTALTLL